jgi:hypothetical protein
MKAMNRSLPMPVFLAVLVAAILLWSSGPAGSTEAAASADASVSSIDQMMAGLSDEQVRQLLIEELRKDAAAAEAEPGKMKGPAHFLARLLGIMARGHDDNTEEVRTLFSAFGTMGPDFYRVFVKL